MTKLFRTAAIACTITVLAGADGLENSTSAASSH
jgi:hypothetical protein